jgi:hypothetical protein
MGVGECLSAPVLGQIQEPGGGTLAPVLLGPNHACGPNRLVSVVLSPPRNNRRLLLFNERTGWQ